MSHWYHRNALKATTNQSFNLSMVSAKPEAIQVCEQLRKTRLEAIQLMTDPSADPELVDKQVKLYLSLLLGLVFNYNLNPNYGPTDSSKLRHYIKFKWTDSLLGSVPTAKQDSVFELISMCIEYALWLTKHCSHLAAKPEITMDTAKEVHKCLRRAAGVFSLVLNQW